MADSLFNLFLFYAHGVLESLFYSIVVLKGKPFMGRLPMGGLT